MHMTQLRVQMAGLMRYEVRVPLCVSVTISGQIWYVCLPQCLGVWFPRLLAARLYEVRMPHVKATVIQRAVRAWKQTNVAGAMAGVWPSNEPEDMQAMMEADGTLMADKYELSRTTKVALKEKVLEKQKQIDLLYRLMDFELCDSRGTPIGESIERSISKLIEGDVWNVAGFREVKIRLGMFKHAWTKGTGTVLDELKAQPMTDSFYTHRYEEIDIERLITIPFDDMRRPKRRRQYIECELLSDGDENGADNAGFITYEDLLDDNSPGAATFVYNGLERWNSGEDNELCVYVLWKTVGEFEAEMAEEGQA